MFRQVDDEIVQQLAAIVGADNVLLDAERLEPYTHDETVGLRADPEVAVRVTSAQQVAEIFRLANRERLPVTPRGAGYGLSGGAVAVQGGIVLSLEKMNRILEIDKENLMVTVEPGVITGDLHRAVEAEGLFYPPDPASLDSCSIGGNIAEGAGGPRAVKYGTTKDYVCGLEAVLPSGDIVHMGGKLVKNQTGYNLVQLLVGSEGTLAVVTKIILRLLPLPPCRVDLLVPFDDFQTAAGVVSAIIARRIVPTTIEFMERDIVHACQRLLGKELPYTGAAAQLLIQLDGNHQAALDADCETVAELCLAAGALDVLVATDRPTRDRLWEARRAIIDSLNHASPVNHMEDLVVPRARIPDAAARHPRPGRAAGGAHPELWPRRRRQRPRHRAQGQPGRGGLGGAGAPGARGALPAGPVAGWNPDRRARHRRHPPRLPAPGPRRGPDRGHAPHPGRLRPQRHPEPGQDLSLTKRP